MKPLIIATILLLGQSSTLAEVRQIKIGNPTKQPYDLFFKPEGAKKFSKHPMRLEPLENVVLNLAAPGKYRTVLRSWSEGSAYVDNTIGWVDFHSVSLEKPGKELRFEPYTVPETKTKTYTVTRYVKQLRTRDDGTTYTVTVPIREEKTQSYTVIRTGVRATLVSRDSTTGEMIESDASKYISSTP